VNWRLPAGKLSPIHFRAIQRIYGATPGAAPLPRLPASPPCRARPARGPPRRCACRYSRATRCLYAPAALARQRIACSAPLETMQCSHRAAPPQRAARPPSEAGEGQACARRP